MAAQRKRYSETFKRQVLARVTAAPRELAAIAREFDVPLTTVHGWRKQYAAPPVSPLPEGEGPGVRACLQGPGVTANPDGPEVTLESPADAPLAARSPRLRQSLLETAFALTAAIREAADNAPLNQVSAALALVIDRLVKLESLAAREDDTPDSPDVLRIVYTYPDGTHHFRPPWAPDDPAFERFVVRDQLRSPFWDSPDDEPADDPQDNPASA